MGRKIVVLADGTGNSAAKPFKTNVWRLYQALDLHGGNQLAVFADGVGTSGFRLWAILGLALGFGVKRRVLKLYKFLCLNFKEGDEIYAFGFSRGAFIVRVLVGMIQREGLVDFKSHDELNRNAAAAYRSYRAKVFRAKRIQVWVPAVRALRRGIANLSNYLTGSRSYEAARPSEGPRAAGNVQVRFVGVWDTVAAYGLPVEELTRAFDQVVWPLTFTSNDLLPCVQTARQAFAIDDERRTFFPIRWNETPDLVGSEDDEPPRLRQVWFAGSHSNVGGGYPDDRLSHLPLCWMIGEAARAELQFKPEIVADYWDYASEAGRVYDSRSGLGITYRYHPRPTVELMGGVKPLIHSSVILRLKQGNDRYAPVAIPGKIEVLTPFGERRELNFVEPGVVDSIEDPLPLPPKRTRDLGAMQQKVLEIMGSVRPDDPEQNEKDVELLMDTIWWRRGLYFIMLGLALFLLAFPLLVGDLTSVRFNEVGKGIVGPILALLQSVLPGFARPWIEAIGENSVLAVAILAAFWACLWLNNVLRSRIVDRAREIWKASERADGQLLDFNRKVAGRRSALAFAIVCLIAAILAALYPQDANAPISDGDPAAAIKLLAGGLSVLFFAAWTFLSFRNGTETSFVPDLQKAESAPLTLRIARCFRTNRTIGKLYELSVCCIGPGLFLLVAAVLSIAVINKVALQITSATGSFCPKSEGDRPGSVQQLLANGPFVTNSLCHDTGIRLDSGVTYLIKLEVTDPWKDNTEIADVRGFLSGDTHGFEKAKYYLGNLFKRSWGEPYFKVIARVGRRGNDEYVLEQLQPERLERGQNAFLFAVVKPKTSGQLYLYVNDIGIVGPRWTKPFYDSNHGSATINVSRVANEAFDRLGP